MAFIYSRAASWKQEAARGASVSLNGEAGRHVGSEITIAQGQIAATHRTANAELKHRIAAILSADSGPLLATRGGALLPRPDGRPMMAYVISVAEPGGGSPQQARAMVVLIDSDKQSEPTEHILRLGFGLTPAETRVAIGFARGRDLHEIANDQGLSIETVRKCFKAVLANTNMSRQAELAILLARLAQRPGEQSAFPLAPDRHTRFATRPEPRSTVPSLAGWPDAVPIGKNRSMARKGIGTKVDMAVTKLTPSYDPERSDPGARGTISGWSELPGSSRAG